MEFYQEYFLINLKDYKNIGIDLPIVQVMLIFACAMIAAIIAINCIKFTANNIIKKLIRHEALTEESAMTLGELGLNKGRYRRALDPYKKLAKIVGRVGEKEYTYDEYVELLKDENFSDAIDFETARFYVRSDEKDSAMRIYETSDSVVLHTVMQCLFIVAITACLTFLMPSILSFVNDMLV